MSGRTFLALAITGLVVAAILFVLAAVLDVPLLAAVASLVVLAVLIARAAFVHGADDL